MQQNFCKFSLVQLLYIGGYTNLTENRNNSTRSSLHYQRYEKRLEQQKGHPDVNVCAAEENFQEELSLNQYPIIVSVQISTLVCLCS